MLADKLLAAPSYDTDREVISRRVSRRADRLGEYLGEYLVQVRHLELLKKRFGDAALASCEVMLRDVDESRRITKQIHQVRNHSNGRITKQIHQVQS